MEATLDAKNFIKDFLAISATVSLIAGVCNYTNSHYLPTTTDDGVVSNRDSIPTLVIPDIKITNE